MRNSMSGALTAVVFLASTGVALAQATSGADTTTGTTTGTVGAPSDLRQQVVPPDPTIRDREAPDAIGTPDIGGGNADGDAAAPTVDREVDRDVVGTTPSISTSTSGPVPDTSSGAVVPGTQSGTDVPDATAGAIGGGSLAEPGMEEAELRDELQAQGVEDIGPLEGPFYTATAEWNGESVELRIDARTGEIISPAEIAGN